MSKRYAIWDKESPVITPIGEVLSAAQWKQKYPVAALKSVTVVCAAGEINGGFFGTLGQMKQIAQQNGAVFADDLTGQALLDAIESFEDAMNAPSTQPTADERIAAALEYQVLSSLPDEEG